MKFVTLLGIVALVLITTSCAGGGDSLPASGLDSTADGGATTDIVTDAPEVALDTPCVPSCGGKECGDDGCGGTCGECADEQICSEAGMCEVVDCAGKSYTIEGTFSNSVEDFEFDAAEVALLHKIDVDLDEDGCIASVEVYLRRGTGCTLHLIAGSSFGQNGGLLVQEFALQVDSQCPGFSDALEGLYEDSGDLLLAEIVLDDTELSVDNVQEWCFPSSLTIHLSGTVYSLDAGAQIDILPSSITVSGNFLSTGDDSLTCPCQPDCTDKECGGDGCGGSCGTCGDGFYCGQGTCEEGECVPDCNDKECGSDGCEGSCGDCNCGEDCEAGVCVFVACEGKECGSDGCGGSCGECTAFPNSYCTDGFACSCSPICGVNSCGNDGCGGSCGTCSGQDDCEGGVCVCQPDCVGKDCGADGCGGSCGMCSGQDDCEGGICVCQPDCVGKDCGADGCGGSCGTCSGQDLCVDGSCVVCQPDCVGKDCGADGCGGSCGECDPDLEECSETATGGFACTAKMVEIPAGNFWMGCNNCAGSTVNDTDCVSQEHPYHEVYLDAYEIDKTEVTADQYAACVSAGGCTAAGTGIYATYQISGKESHPINYVTWFKVEDYCLWAGKELCTEAQWEKGARGGCEHNGGTSNCKAESRKYPWGNAAPTCDLAVMFGCPGDTQAVCSLSPAGDSPYGLCDMAGNVWEWVADWYQQDYYCDGDGAIGDGYCTECGSWPDSPNAWNNPYCNISGSYRVFRGGGFGAGYGGLRVSDRGGGDPSGSGGSSGGRCCRSE